MTREPTRQGQRVSGRIYEFRVSGQLSDQLQDAVRDFGGFQIVPAPPETLIYGSFIDQAHLCRIVRLCGNLGLSVQSLRRLPEARSDGCGRVRWSVYEDQHL